MDAGRISERGSGTVEHAALVVLAAVVAIAGVAGARLLASDPHTPELASALLRKQRCAVRYPDPCWQDPLTEAYGRPLAGAVRGLAPPPATLEGLVGVDYRSCRQARCATPLPGTAGLRLTISNRRTATFVAVREVRAAAAEIDYWIYRPTLGWQLLTETATADQIRALAGTPLLDDADPKLIPLELLLGRDEARFPPNEEPPWRGTVDSRWGR
jgi:hypothetical protein